jgi:hypothetical protein
MRAGERAVATSPAGRINENRGWVKLKASAESVDELSGKDLAG